MKIKPSLIDKLLAARREILAIAHRESDAPLTREERVGLALVAEGLSMAASLLCEAKGRQGRKLRAWEEERQAVRPVGGGENPGAAWRGGRWAN